MFSKSDEQKIISAIREVEAKTSGEVHVHIAKTLKSDDVLQEARLQFTRLGIHKTKYKNGVLILIIEQQHKLACLGDQGIHDHVTSAFWDAVVARLTAGFKKGSAVDTLVAEIATIGTELSRFFPYEGGDKNELPDDISRS